MHVLVTGANGFIGRHLVARLLEGTGEIKVSRLTAMDLALDNVPEHPLVNGIAGSFSDDSMLASAMAEHVDLVFHLASVPSGLAEENYNLGVEVNVQGTMALLDRLMEQGNCPAVIFASSIAVYGKPASAEVNDETAPTPNLSYGAQKVIGETLLADYVRRKWVRGCSLRLPGIVARPPEPNGAVSIFFSDLIRNLASSKPFTCPVSAQAKSWLMSVDCCVDNLMHAASLGHEERHTWTLPAMHIAIEELVNEINELFPDTDVRDLVTYAPDPWVEDNFGSYPPLACPRAEAAGFHHDGSTLQLVANAVASIKSTS